MLISLVTKASFFISEIPLLIKYLSFKGLEYSVFIEIFSPFKISSFKDKLKLVIS